MIIYKISRFLVMIFYNIFYPHKIYGRKNMPKDENFILVSNHYAKIDAVVVSNYFKRRPYFLAKKELMKNKFVTWLFRKYGMIPVDRSKADFAAMKECFGVLKNGENLIIFPEGTRNRTDDELHDVKGGASMIAFKAGVKIVPSVMESRFKMFHKNYAYIGEPFDYSEFAGKKLNSETLAELEKKLTEKLEECRVKLIESKGKGKKS